VSPVFDKNLHSYVDPADNFKFQSVTQWVNTFKKPFDKMTMAARVAKKQKTTVAEVLAGWDKIRDSSTEFGTNIHKILERFFTTQEYEPENETLIESIKLLNINFDIKKTHFEKIVFSKNIGIAGTADVIEHESKHLFNVYDFKTNKNFRISSKYEEQMLGPLNHLPSTEYFIYALQVSMYAYLYECMTGRTPARLRILWLNRYDINNYSSHHGAWKVFNVPYLKDEILQCINQSTEF